MELLRMREEELKQTITRNKKIKFPIHATKEKAQQPYNSEYEQFVQDKKFSELVTNLKEMGITKEEMRALEEQQNKLVRQMKEID